MSTTTDEEEYSSFKVFKFNGTKNKFREWKIKSLAYARRKGFETGFTQDLSTAIKDEDKEARNKAMDYLIGALTGSPFDLVTTETQDDPFESWKTLLENYEDNEQEALQDLQQELVDLKMKEDKEPKDYVSKLRLLNESS